MALYVQRLCPGKAIHSNFTFTSRKITGSLCDSSELLEIIRWGVFTAQTTRGASSHHHGYKLHRSCTTTSTDSSNTAIHSARHRRLMPYDATEAGRDAATRLTVPVDGAMVCLSDLYSRDPLALLLHSHMQVYAGNGISSMSLNKRQPSAAPSPNSATCKFSASPVFSTWTSVPCSSSGSGVGGGDSTKFYRNTTFNGSLCAIAPTEHGSQSLLCLSGASLPSPVCRTSTAEATNDKTGGDDSRNPGLPSPSQLKLVNDHLIEALPKLFSGPINYKFYDVNIIFENRIRGTTTVGMKWYVMQMAMFKMVGHIKFSFVACDILKITQHPEEGTIKVRWRIRGSKSAKPIINVWKTSKFGREGFGIDNSPNWYDGFSTFTVNSAGKIVRHVADNMMPDDEKLSVGRKPGLAATVAVALGLLPKPEHGSAMGGLADCY